MTEAAIKPGLFSDMYISLVDPIDIETGVWAVRLQSNLSSDGFGLVLF